MISKLHEIYTKVGLQANVPQPLDEPDDDIDTALNNLQLSLDGGNVADLSTGIYLSVYFFVLSICLHLIT